MSKRARPLLQDDAFTAKSQPGRKRDPAQPNLPFDPMPDRVEPCLALLKTAPPVGPDWAYEIKWDGYRLAIHIEPKGVRIITRGGHDWTHRFPAIAAAAKDLGVGTAILDGEAVVLNADGRSDFGALQRSLGGRGGKRSSTESILFAFDLLYFDGHDLTVLLSNEGQGDVSDPFGIQTSFESSTDHAGFCSSRTTAASSKQGSEQDGEAATTLSCSGPNFPVTCVASDVSLSTQIRNALYLLCQIVRLLALKVAKTNVSLGAGGDGVLPGNDRASLFLGVRSF
jgi:hypothetical protein